MIIYHGRCVLNLHKVTESSKASLWLCDQLLIRNVKNLIGMLFFEQDCFLLFFMPLLSDIVNSLMSNRCFQKRQTNISTISVKENVLCSWPKKGIYLVQKVYILKRLADPTLLTLFLGFDVHDSFHYGDQWGLVTSFYDFFLSQIYRPVYRIGGDQIDNILS